jgi:hypothetical protein
MEWNLDNFSKIAALSIVKVTVKYFLEYWKKNYADMSLRENYR